MTGVSVAGCWIYGAGCDATCAIAASEMVWVKGNRLVLRMPGTNLKSSLVVGSKMIYLGCDKDQWRWRSKCISYMVLRGAIWEQ